jgi:hypothetical protein
VRIKLANFKIQFVFGCDQPTKFFGANLPPHRKVIAQAFKPLDFRSQLALVPLAEIAHQFNPRKNFAISRQICAFVIFAQNFISSSPSSWLSKYVAHSSKNLEYFSTEMYATHLSFVS